MYKKLWKVVIKFYGLQNYTKYSNMHKDSEEKNDAENFGENK